MHQKTNLNEHQAPVRREIHWHFCCHSKWSSGTQLLSFPKGSAKALAESCWTIAWKGNALHLIRCWFVSGENEMFPSHWAVFSLAFHKATSRSTQHWQSWHCSSADLALSWVKRTNFCVQAFRTQQCSSLLHLCDTVNHPWALLFHCEHQQAKLTWGLPSTTCTKPKSQSVTQNMPFHHFVPPGLNFCSLLKQDTTAAKRQCNFPNVSLKQKCNNASSVILIHHNTSNAIASATALDQEQDMVQRKTIFLWKQRLSCEHCRIKIEFTTLEETNFVIFKSLATFVKIVIRQALFRKPFLKFHNVLSHLSYL